MESASCLQNRSAKTDSSSLRKLSVCDATITFQTTASTAQTDETAYSVSTDSSYLMVSVTSASRNGRGASTVLHEAAWNATKATS